MAPRPPSKRRKRQADSRLSDDLPLGILVTAKRIGLSFDELNLLTLDDYVSFVEVWTGDEEPDGDRRATPEDIKSVLG